MKINQLWFVLNTKVFSAFNNSIDLNQSSLWKSLDFKKMLKKVSLDVALDNDRGIIDRGQLAKFMGNQLDIVWEMN